MQNGCTIKTNYRKIVQEPEEYALCATGVKNGDLEIKIVQEGK